MTTPASAGEALDLLLGALGYLAAIDPTTAPAESQAECLGALERANAVSTAVRARYLNAFTANQGYCADADYSPTGWLINKTGVTKGAARAHQRWARRARVHPRIEAALAEGTVLTESMAQLICQWTGKLPESCRDAADEILVAAARAGARKEDLAALAAEIYARSLPDDDDDDPAMAFDDRQVRVETTFEGAGVIAGDLTPECAAIVTAVLESLSAPMGAEDNRTREQRYHDALQEAMRRLVASGLLPERAGQPVKVWVHMSLAELRALDDGSLLQDQWITEMAARWAALRAAAADGSGSDGAAWLDGKAAGAAACDASITPVVTGDVDPGVLDRLMRLCIELDRLEHGAHSVATGDHTGQDPVPQPPEPAASPSQQSLRQAIIGQAVELLSGPGGLAGFLRQQQLGARLSGPSLPLDIGYSKTIPPGIRNAVVLRDRRCRWPGGCNQPAAACQVHHVKHLADGGPTSLADCVLLCSFHHQVVIHRWGWALVLNPDGTTMARSPDGGKVLRSHGPPARAG